MNCEYCNQNHAQYLLHMDIMGTHREMYVCDDCVKNIQQLKTFMTNSMAQNPWGITDFLKVKTIEQSPKQQGRCREIPSYAGDELVYQRKIKSLTARLQQAIEKEEYEQAVVLRDMLEECKKEAHLNEQP